MKTNGSPDKLTSLMKAVFKVAPNALEERVVTLSRFRAYCQTHDIGFLLEPNDAQETQLSRLLKVEFDKSGHHDSDREMDNYCVRDIELQYWQPRYLMMNMIVDSLYAKLPGQALFKKIAQHRTTNGFEVLNFAIVKTSQERADAFIAFLQSMSQSERLSFLRWQSNAGMNNGKTVLWLLSLGLMNETPWPFIAAWELAGSELTAKDLDVTALDGQHSGKSVKSFLEKADQNNIVIQSILHDCSLSNRLSALSLQDINLKDATNEDDIISSRQNVVLMSNKHLQVWLEDFNDDPGASIVERSPSIVEKTSAGRKYK